MTDSTAQLNTTLLNQILTDVLDVTRDIVLYWSSRDIVLHFNGRLEAAFGYRDDEITSLQALKEIVYFADKVRLAQTLDNIAQLDAQPVTLEHRIITRTGDVRWVQTSLRRIRPQWLGSSLIIGTIADIDSEKRARNKLREKTFRDPLTGLPNRSLLEYKLQTYMESAQRSHKSLALITLDLDNFKEINESYGYGFGDNILRQIGDVLLAELPVDTTVFRVGGDEFVLLVKNLESRTDIEQIMQNIMKSLAASIEVQEQLVSVQASAGISIYPDDCTTSDDIQNNAMIALKKAKDQGTGNWCYFNPHLRASQLRRADLEKRLRRAIEKREFHLVYQPQYDAQTGKISGLESLIRWQDPEHGLISPTDFIPLAEELGLMVPIGTFVLETACAQTIHWQELGVPVVPVAVNISTAQILDAQFLTVLRRTLAKTGLDPHLLEVEITESVFLDSSESVQALFEKIRQLGVRIALDDFGTGYSSLTYLKNLPIDRLKIDRAFIHDMKQQSVETAITGTIVALAHILDLEVVAEGVENLEQFEYLRRVGCNHVQGYYFSKPLPSSTALELLQRSDTIPLEKLTPTHSKQKLS